MPQTWEDPAHGHRDMPESCMGDNDPLDVVELGDAIPTGEICTIKVLGCIALIDEGEVDWKVIGIHSTDPMAQVWHKIEDVDQAKIDSVFRWFQYYKTTDGKPENSFGLNRRVAGIEYTYDVIRDAHASWRKLREAPRNPKLWIKE